MAKEGEEKYSLTDYYDFVCKVQPWKTPDGKKAIAFSLSLDSRAIGKSVDSRLIPASEINTPEKGGKVDDAC